KGVSSWLPSDQDVELSAPSPAPNLPGCRHASHHFGNGLNL
ncbi:mCG145948, partial [Mus musculus]